MDMILFTVVFRGGSRNNFDSADLLPQIDAVKLLTACATESQWVKPLFPMLGSKKLRLQRHPATFSFTEGRVYRISLADELVKAEGEWAVAIDRVGAPLV